MTKKRPAPLGTGPGRFWITTLSACFLHGLTNHALTLKVYSRPARIVKLQKPCGQLVLQALHSGELRADLGNLSVFQIVSLCRLQPAELTTGQRVSVQLMFTGRESFPEVMLQRILHLADRFLRLRQSAAFHGRKIERFQELVQRLTEKSACQNTLRFQFFFSNERRALAERSRLSRDWALREFLCADYPERGFLFRLIVSHFA